MSIVAITGDNLELQGLDSLEDVGNNIPNINIQGGGAGTYGTAFTIRGLPNVGVYLDGVWQVGTSGLLVSDFIDLDRVEVLRGPQGTTYGRDSVGGAIRMWTKRPGDEFGGQITATAGSYERRDVKASLDLPITERLRSKWTGSSIYRDGFIEGLTTGLDYGLLDCVFRRMPVAGSGPCRSRIPEHAGQRSGPCRSGDLTRVNHATVAPFFDEGSNSGASEVTRAQDSRGVAAAGRGLEGTADRRGHRQRAVHGAGVLAASARGRAYLAAAGRAERGSTARAVVPSSGAAAQPPAGT